MNWNFILSNYTTSISFQLSDIVCVTSVTNIKHDIINMSRELQWQSPNPNISFRRQQHDNDDNHYHITEIITTTSTHQSTTATRARDASQSYVGFVLLFYFTNIFLLNVPCVYDITLTLALRAEPLAPMTVQLENHGSRGQAIEPQVHLFFSSLLFSY